LIIHEEAIFLIRKAQDW